MSPKYFSLIFLCSVCLMRNSDGARILGIFPSAVSSNFAVFRTLLLDLADKGHRVDIVSHFPLKRPHPNCKNIIVLGGKSESVADKMTIEFVEKIGSTNIDEYFVEAVGNELCHSLGNPEVKAFIENPPNDPPYDIVITELFYASCYFAFGRHLKVPMVAITPGSTLHYSNEPLGNPLNTAFVPEHPDGSIVYMNFWQRLKNTLYTLSIIHRIRQLSEVQNDAVKKYFGPEMPDIRELEKDLSLLLVNSHYTLNGIRPMTPAVVEVGGIHIGEDEVELPRKLQEWLDHGTNGFIYISFGNLLRIESLPGKILSEMFKALGKMAPLRVLMKSTDPEKLPPGLPDNVVTLKWVPELQIMQHRNLRGIITDGTLSTIHEATVFGIPFVGIPILGDHQRNVKNCVDKGVAVYLNYKEITANTFVEAVNAVVHDPNYKTNMAALSKQFLNRPISPRHAAVHWVEYIINHGGDSLRSPAVKLAWWQLALLDIHGSIVIAAIVSIWLIKLLISAVIRRVLRKTMLPMVKKKN